MVCPTLVSRTRHPWMKFINDKIPSLPKSGVLIMIFFALLVCLNIPNGFANFNGQPVSLFQAGASENIPQQSSDSQRGRTRLESMIAARETSGSLFDNVATVLLKKY